MFTGRRPTNDIEETLLNAYLAWNTPHLSIPTAHPLHLIYTTPTLLIEYSRLIYLTILFL